VNDGAFESSQWTRSEEDGVTTIPFFSSMVTVSFAHFIKNLPWIKVSVRSFEWAP
jgi:hypothetical protein